MTIIEDGTAKSHACASSIFPCDKATSFFISVILKRTEACCNYGHGSNIATRK